MSREYFLAKITVFRPKVFYFGCSGRNITKHVKQVDEQRFTLLGVQSWVRFCRQEFGEFTQLVGRYCSYLLPKQAGGTRQILVDKTLRMTSRLRVYSLGRQVRDLVVLT